MIRVDEQASDGARGWTGPADRPAIEFLGFSDKMNPSPSARGAPAQDEPPDEMVFVSPPPAPFPRVFPGL